MQEIPKKKKKQRHRGGGEPFGADESKYSTPKSSGGQGPSGPPPQQQGPGRQGPPGPPPQQQGAGRQGPPGSPPQQQGAGRQGPPGSPPQQQGPGRQGPSGPPPQQQGAGRKGPSGPPPQQQGAGRQGPPGSPPQQQGPGRQGPSGPPPQQQGAGRKGPSGPPPQQQGAWRQRPSGPPPQQQGTWRQGPSGPPPQPQGAWRQGPSGPPPQQQGPGRQGPSGPPPQQQGAGRQGPSGPPPQQQGAGRQGPPGSPPQQQGPGRQGPPGPPPQQQGAGRQGPPGPPPQQQGAGRQGPPGPPPQQQGPGRQGPPGPPPQQQGPGRQGPPGPPPQQQGPGRQGPSGPPPQQQGAWRQGPPGPPPQQQGPGRQGPSGPPPQQQGAWRQGPSGPPPQQQGAGRQGPPGPPPQQQGAWRQGPSGPPPQPQGAWRQGPSGPPPQQQGPGRQGPSGPPPQKEQKKSAKHHDPQTPRQEHSAQRDILAVSEGISQLSTPRTPEKQKPTSAKVESTPSTLSFAPRIFAPKKSGRPITVTTNFFRLLISNCNLIVYNYDVKMDPDKPKYLIRDVWNKFAAREFPGRLTAFSGKNAYSNGPLMEEQSRVGSIIVFNPETNREKEFNVEVTEVKRVKFDCFESYRQKMLKDSSMKVLPEEQTTILDIILRNWACDNFIRSGRSFYSPSSKRPKVVPLSEKLLLQNGYYQAAFLGDQLYVNFDIAHKTFYRPLHVLDLVKCFQRNEKVNVEDMNQFIRGMKIQYELPNDPKSRKIYSVNCLVNDANSQTFKNDEGKEITVADYLQKEKNLKLKYPKLPLLWVGSRQRSIYLPMEFCTVIPDQPYNGQVDPNETRQMVAKATSDARQRKADVYKIFSELNINAQPLLREFGLTVSGEMEQVEGRVLNPPALTTSKYIKVKDGTWRTGDFLKPRNLEKWCILKMDRRVSRQNVLNLQNLIKAKGRNFNMRVEEPSRELIEVEDRPGEMQKVLKQLGDMDLVIVIIPDVKGVYSKVKAICETEEKVLTQCIKSRTVLQDERKLSTTVENILLKVNAKLGGVNHSFDQSSFPNTLKGKVMIIGADVTHPSPGMKIPSVAAVAVSCDEAAFKYSCTIRAQPKGEMIIDLEEIIHKHVLEFKRLRQCYPEKILFFRDGVSEGELEKVFNFELAALKKACRKYCEPKITFLVVQKRHHTRFHPTSERDEVGRNYNVPPGTCIDTKVVHPRDLDFYLVSHASILGTARPTRYRLLYDDNKLTDDELETLSFYLCHMFARCNRAVSYPTPTYNAHLAAFRARAYLEYSSRKYSGQFDISDFQMHLRDNISDKAPMFFV